MNASPARLLAVAGCLLALAGCASGPKKDMWATRGRPIPVPNEPAPTPPQNLHVTGIGGLQQALEARVMAAAGLLRPVQTQCDAMDIAPSLTCRIIFLRQVITYNVTTQETSATTFQWRATPDALVATKTGIEATLWRKYATQATAIRCDAGLPAQQRVRPGSALPQRCYFKPTSGNQYYGKNTGNAGRTVAVGITISDGRIDFEPRIQ